VSLDQAVGTSRPNIEQKLPNPVAGVGICLTLPEEMSHAGAPQHLAAVAIDERNECELEG
jgi:hypothetical protein